MTTSPDSHTVSTRGITGDGVPHGFTSLTPFLAVPNTAGAIEFYRTVFGARVVDVTEMGRRGCPR